MIKHIALTLMMALSSHAAVTCAAEVPQAQHASRAQLSIGYSLLYQEADGIPKLKWLLMFKDKPEETGQLLKDLIAYYEQLSSTMQRLAKQYPGMHIDAVPMSEIEGDMRKAIGEDLAKDFAPLIGKTGVDFEREALLVFDDSLNEQWHLTGVMLKLETVPALKQFLETTQSQLQTRHAKVEALLNRRYFTH